MWKMRIKLIIDFNFLVFIVNFVVKNLGNLGVKNRKEKNNY